MEIRQIQVPVADYCKALERDEIEVNRDYQRSDRVWPLAARQFLIETILLDYPIPKLTLHQITNLRTKSTLRAVVDGQQRTRAIYDFYRGELRLSTRATLSSTAGRYFAGLPEDLQERFLGYILSMDLLLTALPHEVRDIFRRINAYTVPLNPEETRHALFQGPFKWFIYRLGADFGDEFTAMGILTEKQLVRMQDTKLLAEVCHALLNGVQTTTKAKLDALYRKYNDNFAEEGGLDGRLRRAMARLVDLRELYRSELMKPYQVYALLLALSHFEEPVETLLPSIPAVPHGPFDHDRVVSSLASLDEALANDDERGRYGAFVRASSSKTNVAEQRLTRIRAIYAALCGAGADEAGTIAH